MGVVLQIESKDGQLFTVEKEILTNMSYTIKNLVKGEYYYFSNIAIFYIYLLRNVIHGNPTLHSFPSYLLKYYTQKKGMKK